jgi:hypothetical protein
MCAADTGGAQHPEREAQQVRISGFGLQLAGFCAVAAFSAGCGALKPQWDQSVAAADVVGGQIGSWMAPEAKSEALLYTATEKGVYITSYPHGKLVGTLAVASGGLCSDSHGNVFVTGMSAQDIVEYAHGGTSPIATLEDPGYFPYDCSFDGTTGNLAVSNYATSSGGYGNIAIYPDEQGPPVMYSDPDIYRYYACGYDNNGNLFVVSADGPAPFAELPKGSKAFRNFNVTYLNIGGVQWDGKYIAESSFMGQEAEIYRLSASGSTLKVKGLVLLGRGQRRIQLRFFWIGGGKIVGTFGNHAGFWGYPAGDKPIKVLSYGSPTGVTVSYPGR